MSTTRRIARKAQTRKMANRHRTFRGLKHGESVRMNNLTPVKWMEALRLTITEWKKMVGIFKKVGVTAKQAAQNMESIVLKPRHVARKISTITLKHSDLPDDIF